MIWIVGGLIVAVIGTVLMVKYAQYRMDASIDDIE